MMTHRDAYRVMLREYPDILNIEQMCEILKISTKTGYRLLKDGQIQNLKIGRSYRIPKAHLVAYLLLETVRGTKFELSILFGAFHCYHNT